MCVTDRKRQGYRKQKVLGSRQGYKKAESPLIGHCYIFSGWGSNSTFEALLFLSYLLLLFSFPNIIVSISLSQPFFSFYYILSIFHAQIFYNHYIYTAAQSFTTLKKIEQRILFHLLFISTREQFK